MCARAKPPARTTAQAAAQVRRVEARAPALAAAATCPLRPADLVQPDLADLLELVARCARQQAAGVTLREARVVGEDTDTAVALLVSLARRIVWRGPQVARHPALGRRLGRQEVLQALCGLLTNAFSVDDGPDRSTAVREAAERCVAQALCPAACQQLAASRRPAPSPSTASVRAQVRAARHIRPGRRPGHVVGGPGGEQPGQGGALCDLRSARRVRARPATGAPPRPRLAHAGLRGLRPSGRRAEQVVALWSLKGATEAWGGAAAPGAALLTQYHSGMSAVFLWLTSAPQPLPPRALTTEAAHSAERETMLGDGAQARAARTTSRRLQPRQRAPRPTAPRAARRSTCAPQRCCTTRWTPRARRRTPRTWRPSAAPPRATSLSPLWSRRCWSAAVRAC